MSFVTDHVPSESHYGPQHPCSTYSPTIFYLPVYCSSLPYTCVDRASVTSTPQVYSDSLLPRIPVLHACPTVIRCGHCNEIVCTGPSVYDGASNSRPLTVKHDTVYPDINHRQEAYQAPNSAPESDFALSLVEHPTSSL